MHYLWQTYYQVIPGHIPHHHVEGTTVLYTRTIFEDNLSSQDF